MNMLLYKNMKSLICFIVSFATFMIGIYKLLFYRPHETFRNGINTYGFKWSSTELILNTNRAIAMFNITIIFLILGFGFLIISKKK